MERFVLPVWDPAVSIVRRKSEASSEALEAPSIMRMHLGGEVHYTYMHVFHSVKFFGLNFFERVLFLPVCMDSCVIRSYHTPCES